MDKIMAQLDQLVDRYEELTELMADPEVISDTKRYLTLSKEADRLQPLRYPRLWSQNSISPLG